MTKSSNDERNAPAPLTRWLLRPVGSGDAEERLVTLIRAGASAEGLGAGARARVWSRISMPKRRFPIHSGLRWSVAAGVLLTSGAVVGAVKAYGWWRAVPGEPAPFEVRAHPKGRMRQAIRTHLEAPHTAGPFPPDTLPPTPLAANPEDSPAANSRLVPDVEGSKHPGEVGTFARRGRPTEAGSSAPHVLAASVAPSSADVLDVAPSVPRATPDIGTADAPPRRLEPPLVEAAPTPGEVTSVQSRDAPMPSSVAPARPPANTAEAPASALSGEARLLTEALNRLRQQRDVVGAIAMLDAYDARFPTGTLRGESARARVDALLVLGRADDALAVLRSLELMPQGRDAELRLIRGELSARSSCVGAIADFDRVLADAPSPPIAERALHGRAICLSRLGDREGALHDWREYLRRFPQGRFAAEARLGFK